MRSSSSAGCISSAPNAMNPAASTTSSAAVPAVRVIPGSSKFYLSLQDDLLRIFGSERVAKIMDMLKIEEGEAITHGMISRAIENAQKKVEAHNFDIRKHLIEYDDVMNKQREVIYTQRKEILAGQEIRESFLEMMDETIEDIVGSYAIDKIPAAEWDWEGISDIVFKCFNLQLDLPQETMARLNPTTSGNPQ